MIAVRQNVRVSNAITAIALDLARFRIDIDIETEASPKLDFFFKFRRSYPAIHITYFPLVHVKRVNHASTKKPVVSPLDKFGIWTYSIKRS